MTLGSLLTTIITWAVGRLLFAIEPFATGDGTGSLLVRGFALRRRHAARLHHFAADLIESGTLKGKRILVTGSARGLGSGIAAQLVAAGAKLVLPQRNGGVSASALEALAQAGMAAIRACGARAVIQSADIDVLSPCVGLELGSLASIERFVEALATEGVKLDAVINNAGMVPIAPGVTAEGFEPAFGVNYLGTAHLIIQLQHQGVLKSDAVIINISSEEHRLASFDSLVGAPPPSPGGRTPRAPPTDRLGAVPSDASVFNAMERYAYSKLLLTTFSHELSRRLAYPVKDICPGPVASQVSLSQSGSVTKGLTRRIAKGLTHVPTYLACQIARDAPWPINEITQYGMRLCFPSAQDAALPVVELLLSSMPDIRNRPTAPPTPQLMAPTHLKPSLCHMRIARAVNVGGAAWMGLRGRGCMRACACPLCMQC